MEVRGCGYTCSAQAVALQPKWEPEETTGTDTSLKHREGTHTTKRASVDVYTGVSYGRTGCARHPSLAVNQKLRNLTLYPRVSNSELGSSSWIPPCRQSARIYFWITVVGIRAT